MVVGRLRGCDIAPLFGTTILISQTHGGAQCSIRGYPPYTPRQMMTKVRYDLHCSGKNERSGAAFVGYHIFIFTLCQRTEISKDGCMPFFVLMTHIHLTMLEYFKVVYVFKKVKCLIYVCMYLYCVVCLHFRKILTVVCLRF